ncbi:uncharacterized protein LOC132700083 [Cylas formicarius]|uniref:uncharacterized protein LOC132700083 n=1 Tax=Cylas formicarius TaxID=197179 RepID=UPI00295870F1|nr:uncharacterized protein LOC132700083 [Cylas formicarius]
MDPYEIIKSEPPGKCPREIRGSKEGCRVNILVAEDANVLSSFLADTEAGMKIRNLGRKLYLVVLLSGAVQSDDVSGVLGQMWKEYNILNVIAHTPCVPSTRDFVYVHRPFERSEGRYGQTRLYSITDVASCPQILRNDVSNLNGYPLKVSLFQRKPTALKRLPSNLKNGRLYDFVRNFSNFYGVDGVSASELARTMNFSMHMMLGTDSLYYGTTKPDGNVTGSLGQVVRRNIDIQANARYVTEYGTDGFEFTMNCLNDQVCLVGPKAHVIPKWQDISNVFTKHFVTANAAVIIICLCTGLLFKFPIKMKVQNKLLQVESTVLLHPNTSKRIFVMTILFYFYVVSGLISTSLISSFSTTSYYPDINTLEEVDNSGFPIKTSFNIFNKNVSDLYRRLSKKVVSNYPKNFSALELVARFGDCYAVERLKDAKVAVNLLYRGKNGEPLLHVVKECPTSHSLAYIVPAGSPYLFKFNLLLLFFKEHGLNTKWTSDFVHALLLEEYRKEQLTDSRYKFGEGSMGASPFYLQDVQLAFYILIPGYAFSLLAFIVEIIFNKMQPHRRTG